MTTVGDDVLPFSPTSVQNGVHSIRTFLQNRQRKLVFQFNADTGLVTTTVVDAKRQQIVRQIPVEQALKLIF
ncbi:flagellar protein FlaG [Chromatium okenii]|uniref:flagellar protein FlaG n=1 Tax=Chromatium okenii TaxID=61644 RepID=UPI001905645B|nr:flagellar protein FlaG [Chromatium okenii]